MARTNLKVFRVQHKLTQAKMADKIGCMRSTYSAIECGMRHGRQAFWEDLQKSFDVPPEKMWELMKNDTE